MAYSGCYTRYGGSAAARSSDFGIALPPDTALPPATVNASGAADLGLVNQVLHELWRSGYSSAKSTPRSKCLAALPGGSRPQHRFHPRRRVGFGNDLSGPSTGVLSAPLVREDPFVPCDRRGRGQCCTGANTISFQDLTVSQLNLAVKALLSVTKVRTGWRI